MEFLRDTPDDTPKNSMIGAVGQVGAVGQRMGTTSGPWLPGITWTRAR
jgi:hypothetical protein